MEQTNDINNSYNNDLGESIKETDGEGFVTSQHTSFSLNSSFYQEEPIEKIIKKTASLSPTPYVSKEPVLVFQLAVCIVIAAAAFIVKYSGGDIYANIKDIYFQNLDNSIIIDLNNSFNNDFVNSFFSDEQ